MTGLLEPDESELIAAAQAGDGKALDRLLRSHQPRIYAVARRMMGSDADALDVTQEALISIVRSIGSFDGRARFSTWTYRVATNACLDELRRRKRRPALSLATSDGEVLDLADPTERMIDEGVVDRTVIDAALRELTPEFRAAVVLRDLCQLDYAEISEVLEIPPGTVRSRIARGRAQLADLLGGNQNDPEQRQT